MRRSISPNMSFEQQLAYTSPDAIINMLDAMRKITGSRIISDDVTMPLVQGLLQVEALLAKALIEGKIRVFHPSDIIFQDDAFLLPSVDLRDYFRGFDHNDDIVACMVAGGIIASKNSDSEASAWFPRFKTEEEALAFIDIFHELFVRIQLADKPELKNSPVPDRLKPCLDAIESFNRRRGIASYHILIKNEKKYIKSPGAFIALAKAHGHHPDMKLHKDLMEKEIMIDKVGFCWARPDTLSDWKYIGYRILN